MTDIPIEDAREEMFSSDDRDLYLHIGFFATWFAAVEFQITLMLAIATDASNLENFELLIRGMDARVKCDRLRRARNLFKVKPLGPNLLPRLAYFENAMIKIRNKLTHSFVVCPPPRDKFYLTAISRLPSKAYGLDGKTSEPEIILAIDLFERGLWLNLFSDDLTQLLERQPHEENFEIVSPRSPLPPAR